MAVKKYLDYDGLATLVRIMDERYALNGALNFKGTVVTISELPTVAGTHVGDMYNVSTAGTTTADFVEGAGHELQAGDNVVAVNVAAEGDPAEMKWDILGGVFNLEEKLSFGQSLPAAPADGETFLYLGPTTYAYNAVQNPQPEDNPSELGWYEEDGSGGYTLSVDTEPQAGKTYYTRTEQYVKGVIYVWNESGLEWVPQSSGDIMSPITTGEIEALFD